MTAIRTFSVQDDSGDRLTFTTRLDQPERPTRQDE